MPQPNNAGDGCQACSVETITGPAVIQSTADFDIATSHPYATAQPAVESAI